MLQEPDYHKKASESREKKIKKRYPLPDPQTIGQRFVESSIKFFASERPNFWEASIRRFFMYRSDFLGKIRLGSHLDSYDQILKACSKADAPNLKHGKIVLVMPDNEKSTQDTPDVFFHLNPQSEWQEALAELGSLAGINQNFSIATKSKELVNFASKIPLGQSSEIPRKIIESEDRDAMRSLTLEAQCIEPRLRFEGSTWRNMRVFINSDPLPYLVLPSLNEPLLFPEKAIMQERNVLAKRIESIVANEFKEGKLAQPWLVLARSNSRVECQKIFGRLDRCALFEIASKTRLTGMDLFCQFGRKQWILAVQLEEGLTWPQVIDRINQKSLEVPSQEKYGLSKEAASLFDWLKILSKKDLTWGLSPVVTDEFLKTEFGIEMPWIKPNTAVFFELLTEEISDKTPYLAKCYPWREYEHSQNLSIRLRLREKIISN